MTYPSPELLLVLIAFQESKNLVQTAEKLKISQPAVTQRLQRLQEQVTHPLYVFDGRKKVLTQYGKALYEVSKMNFLQLERSFQNINREFANPDQLLLRIGSPKELVGPFSDMIDFSGKIDHRKMQDEEAFEALKSESIDLALISTIHDNSEFMSRKFFESPFKLIVHRKYFTEADSFRDLIESKKSILETPCAFHRTEKNLIQKFCIGVKIKTTDLNNKAIFEDWYSILNYVESGSGFAIVPGFVNSQSKSVKEIDIPHSIIPRINYYAVFQRKLKKIEAFKKVLNFSVSSS